jgi:hypothetical protein
LPYLVDLPFPAASIKQLDSCFKFRVVAAALLPLLTFIAGASSP